MGVEDRQILVKDLMTHEGVGFGPSQVPPIRHCLKFCLDELEPEDFEAMKFNLKHILSKAVLSRADPNKDYSTESSANFTFRKLHILRALEEQYGLDEMAERFKNVMRSDNRVVIYESGQFPLAEVIEDVQKECRRHYEAKRKQGLVIDEKFVGRTKYMTNILKDLQCVSTHIQGVLICGMYGMGKTSLAGRICALLTNYLTVCVDLRKHHNVTDALKAILHSVGRTEEPYNEAALLEFLKSEKKKVVLFLDNADDLMDFGQPHRENFHCQNFHNLLEKIVHVENPQVKLIVTSRFKMAQSDFISQECPMFCKQRLSGRLLEYELHELSQEDAIQLFELEIGKLKDKEEGLLEEEKKEIVEFCGYSPFTIRLAANHLKNTNMTLTQFMDNVPMTPLTPKSPQSPLTFYTSSCVMGDPTTQSILHTTFGNMDRVWREKLMALSVFQGMFDVRSAQAVMGLKTNVDAILDLQYLKCRHLVDMYDIQECSVDPYQEKTVRFTLHTLTQQYLEQVKLQPEWKQFYKDVELRFCQSFTELVWDICKIVKNDRLKGYQQINENECHLKKMISVKEKLQLLDSLEKLKKYKRQNSAIVLFQRFLHDDERLRHFTLQASLAESRMKKLTFCYYSLWKADVLFHKEDLQAIAAELKKTAAVIKEIEDSQNTPNNMKAVKAQWQYIHGRFFHKCNQPEKALKALEKSLTLYVELFGDNYNCARTENLMGTVCFQMHKYEKALKYHSDAYHMMKRKAPNNPHYDMPVYLMNVGTVHHKMGQDKCDNRSEKSEAKEHFMEALKYYNESLKLFHRLNLYGYSHTGQVLKNKVTVLWDLRRHEEAIDLASKKLETICRYLPDDNPEKAANVYFIGSMFMSKGKLLDKKQRREAANEAFKRAQFFFEEAVCRITLSPNYPIHRQDYQHLKEDFSFTLRKLGKQEEWKRVRHKLQIYEAKRKLKPTPKVPSLNETVSSENNEEEEILEEDFGEDDEEEYEEEEDEGDYNDGNEFFDCSHFHENEMKTHEKSKCIAQQVGSEPNGNKLKQCELVPKSGEREITGDFSAGPCYIEVKKLSMAEKYATVSDEDGVGEKVFASRHATIKGSRRNKKTICAEGNQSQVPYNYHKSQVSANEKRSQKHRTFSADVIKSHKRKNKMLMGVSEPQQESDDCLTKRSTNSNDQKEKLKNSTKEKYPKTKQSMQHLEHLCQDRNVQDKLKDATSSPPRKKRKLKHCDRLPETTEPIPKWQTCIIL